MSEEFNLLDYAQGRSRAEDDVSLYLDEKAASTADRYVTKDKNGEKYVTDVQAFQAARDELKQSSVTIHLRGLDEGRVEEIRAEHSIEDGGEFNRTLNDPGLQKYLVEVLSEMYVKTENASGAVDDKPKTVDEWLSFKRVAPKSQWQKLLVKVLNLIFVSNVIDESVDAGFLADS